MDIQKYQAFLKTIEYGSITKAAEVLSYSQSGVSRMIQEVEKELGLPLLERGRGGVRLTSEGIKLLPQIKALCDAYQSLQQQANDLKGLETGLIRIGTFSSAATHWLPNIIKEFQKNHPNIEYELLLGGLSGNRNMDTGGKGGLRLSSPADPAGIGHHISGTG